jgi:antirestriction protein ArdC
VERSCPKGRGGFACLRQLGHENRTERRREDVEREVRFLKGYTVFNVEQIEGLPKIYYIKPDPKFAPLERIGHADAFFAATGANIRYRGGRAYYAQDRDYIRCRP